MSGFSHFDLTLSVDILVEWLGASRGTTSFVHLKWMRVGTSLAIIKATMGRWLIFFIFLFLRGPRSALADTTHITTEVESLPAPETSAQVDVELKYAQSANAWTTVNQIQNAKGDLGAVNAILNQNYGTYQEAISNFTASLHGIKMGNGVLSTLYFETSAEADGTGLVSNPVLPELHASLLGAGIISTGFEGELFPIHLKTHFGVFVGDGIEKRIDAYSTDLIESLPIRDGSFQVFGLEQMLSQTTFLSPHWSWYNKVSARETDFQSHTPAAVNDSETDPSYFAIRLRAETEITWQTHLFPFRQSYISLGEIIGPQPLPVNVLPKIWDFAHRLDTFPDWGAMLGTGLTLRGDWDKSYQTKFFAGFYGGYWGGGLSMELKRITASFGSYGIEGSSAYQILGQRLMTASLSILI